MWTLINELKQIHLVASELIIKISLFISLFQYPRSVQVAVSKVFIVLFSYSVSLTVEYVLNINEIYFLTFYPYSKFKSCNHTCVRIVV